MCAESHTLGMQIISVYVLDYVHVLHEHNQARIRRLLSFVNIIYSTVDDGQSPYFCLLLFVGSQVSLGHSL